jgi:hypothetical protein
MKALEESINITKTYRDRIYAEYLEMIEKANSKNTPISEKSELIDDLRSKNVEIATLDAIIETMEHRFYIHSKKQIV